MVVENSSKINFLDLSLEKIQNKLEYSIYRKPTALNQTIHFSSFHPYSKKNTCLQLHDQPTFEYNIIDIHFFTNKDQDLITLMLVKFIEQSQRSIKSPSIDEKLSLRYHPNSDVESDWIISPY